MKMKEKERKEELREEYAVLYQTDKTNARKTMGQKGAESNKFERERLRRIRKPHHATRKPYVET